MKTLVDALIHAAGEEEFGLRFVDRRQRATHISWSKVVTEAQITAAKLRAAGIQPGDRVALIYPTCREFFAAFFGASWAGAVPVPLYPPVRLGRLEEYAARTARMIQLSSSRLVLTDSRVRRLLGPTIAASIPDLGCKTLDDLPSATPQPPCSLSTSDLAFVQFSSGTTGEPKAVALTQEAVVLQASILLDALLGAWPEEEYGTQSGLSWLPLYHDMGLIGCVFPSLLKRRDLTLLGPELFIGKPTTWLRAISDYKATMSTAPNFAYGLCLHKVKDEEMEGVDLSSWHVALNGAEPISISTMDAFGQRFSRWGFKPTAMTPVYGLSEASLAVTFSGLKSAPEIRNRPGSVDKPIVSVGQALPGFEIDVRGEQGQSLPELEEGNIWIKGPSLMREYLDDPVATDTALVEGWLDTGDLGFIAEQKLYVVGRSKEVLIFRGRNIAPHEVESALDGLPGVRRGCVAAVGIRPESAHSDELVVLVERGADLAEEPSLIEACTAAILEKTGLRCHQVAVLEPGTLPRTSSGKIRRIEAGQRFESGSLMAAPEPGIFGIASAVVRSTIVMPRSSA